MILNVLTDGSVKLALCPLSGKHVQLLAPLSKSTKTIFLMHKLILPSDCRPVIVMDTDFKVLWLKPHETMASIIPASFAVRHTWKRTVNNYFGVPLDITQYSTYRTRSSRRVFYDVARYYSLWKPDWVRDSERWLSEQTFGRYAILHALNQ